MAKATHKEFVRAHVLGDAAKADALNDRIPPEEREEFQTYVTAFFSIMLEQRFGQDSSRDAILAFVNEMRYDYRTAEPPIKPLMIEGVIRASAGEDHFFDEIPTKEVVQAQFLVIAKIAVQSPDVQQRLDEFLTEAEGVVTEWSAQAD